MTELLILGGAALIYFLVTRKSSSSDDKDIVPLPPPKTAPPPAPTKPKPKTSEADEQLYKDMMMAGSWLAIPPERVSSMPSSKTGFTKGEDIFVGIQKYGEGSEAVVRVRVDEVIADEKVGPIARGPVVMLSPLTKEDVMSVSGKDKPALGTVIAVPIAYRLPDEFLGDETPGEIKV